MVHRPLMICLVGGRIGMFVCPRHEIIDRLLLSVLRTFQDRLDGRRNKTVCLLTTDRRSLTVNRIPEREQHYGARSLTTWPSLDPVSLCTTSADDGGWCAPSTNDVVGFHRLVSLCFPIESGLGLSPISLCVGRLRIL